MNFSIQLFYSSLPEFHFLHSLYLCWYSHFIQTLFSWFNLGVSSLLIHWTSLWWLFWILRLVIHISPFLYSLLWFNLLLWGAHISLLLRLPCYLLLGLRNLKNQPPLAVFMSMFCTVRTCSSLPSEFSRDLSSLFWGCAVWVPVCYALMKRSAKCCYGMPHSVCLWHCRLWCMAITLLLKGPQPGTIAVSA